MEPLRRIGILQTPHSGLNLSLPAGMERVELEELRLLTGMGHTVNIYANNVIGHHPHVVNIGRTKKISRLKELTFVLAFLWRNVRADLLIGFYTPMLALLAPRKTFVFFQGDAIFALPLERYRWFLKRYKKACYLFCSDYVRLQFMECHPEIDPSRLFTLYNGVDSKKFCPSPRKRRQGKVRVSFHGRWSERKGILVLLHALRILESKRSDFECYIGGSSEVPFATPESERVRDEVLEMTKGLRTTRLVGAMTHDDLPAFVQDMDLGIVPTISPEPFGIVNLEYMACGLPVIATRTGGIPEIVDDGKTGRLVEPNNAEELAVAIDELLDAPALRERMGEEGRKAVEAKFTWEKHIENLISIYDSINRNE